MAEFVTLINLGLSTYLVRKLLLKSIVTARQFLDADNRHLVELTKLQEADVSEIKRKICELYFPRPKSLLTLKQERKQLLQYGTGIKALDEMLSKVPLMAGSFWEICGKSGIGKTQLCHTVSAHFVADLHCPVLYIDTKCDFSGTRFLGILRARGLDKTTCGQMMHEILVERTLSAEGVCDILENLLKLKAAAGKDQSTAVIGDIKLVVIDALPAVWMNLGKDQERLKGKYLLAKLANLIYKLAKEYKVTFFLVNLLVDVEEECESTAVALEDGCESDSSGTCSSTSSAINQQSTTRPALGAYWKRVPRLRLALELPADAADSNQRNIRVLKSCYSPEGESCVVHITEAGVV